MTSDILHAIGMRRARRALRSDPIDREILERLALAAHWAPSCGNNQPWRFVMIDESDVLSRVKEHLSRGNYWAATSPAILAVASRTDLDCEIPDGRRYYLFGCGMATMNLMLQATALGLIAHPIAGFKQAPIKQVLGIPNDYTLIALVVLGYPSDDLAALGEKHQAEETSERTRRPLEQILFYNRFP